MANRHYFISDTHFSHNNVIKFERTQFETIDEHDDHVVNMYKKLASKLKHGDVVYHLGDWGNLEYLWVNNLIRSQGAKTVFILGNHDKRTNIEPYYSKYFDEVHEHPYFLTDRILLSHVPIMLAEPSMINVCGHLHRATLNSNNHVVCSVDVIDYNPVDINKINKKLGNLPKHNIKFLEESYANLYKFVNFENNSPTDVVTDSDGNINLNATLAYRKMLEIKSVL